MSSDTHFHEAAHAVVALSRGARVFRLEIGRGRFGGLEYAGICNFSAGALPKQVQAEIFLAGPIANQIRNPYFNINGIHDDYAKAAALMGGHEARAVIERTRRRVSNLWIEVARLAEALLVRKIMSEREILVVAQMPPLAWTR